MLWSQGEIKQVDTQQFNGCLTALDEQDCDTRRWSDTDGTKSPCMDSGNQGIEHRLKFWGFIEPSPKLTVKERNAIGMKTKTSGHWRE
jgi:hypothetical protein